MSKGNSGVLFTVFAIMGLLVLLISCQPEIKYRDVIKEVPIEVIIEVPVVDESRINELMSQLNSLQQQHDAELSEVEKLYKANLSELINANIDNALLLQKMEELELAYQKKIHELNNANLDNDTLLQQIEELNLAHQKAILELNNANLGNDELLRQIEELKLAHQKKIKEMNDSFALEKAELQNQLTYEANYQLNELRKYYESQLLQLDEAYNAKLEELNIAYANNNTLLLQIDELENKHKSQIEELNLIYNGKISELEELISSIKVGKIFHLRSYMFLDKTKWYSINSTSHARDTFCCYVGHPNTYGALEKEIVILLDVNNQLENAIAESRYVKGDVDKIRNDMNKDEIAYGYYWEGDYVIQWFIVWQFYIFEYL